MLTIQLKYNDWSLEIEGECTDGGVVATYEEPGEDPEFAVTRVTLCVGDNEVELDPSFLDDVDFMELALSYLQTAWRAGEDMDVDETTDPVAHRKYMRQRQAVGS